MDVWRAGQNARVICQSLMKTYSIGVSDFGTVQLVWDGRDASDACG